MKTKNACFWIFLLLSGSAYAQMSQKGTVQIFNSNKSPLPGVQLTATDAPATDTDANGNFQFNFSKQKPGIFEIIDGTAICNIRLFSEVVFLFIIL